MTFEANLILFLQSGMSEFWIYFFRIVTLFGSWLGFALALIPIYFKKKSLSYGFVCTYGAGVGLNTILKACIGRPRPYVSYPDILNLGGSTGFSLPSGHTNSAVMIAIFLSYTAIKYGKNRWTKICVPIIMGLYLMLIALSRLALGQHYLTDVIAGGVEGVVIATVGIIIFNLIVKRLNNGKKRNEGKAESGSK